MGRSVVTSKTTALARPASGGAIAPRGQTAVVRPSSASAPKVPPSAPYKKRIKSLKAGSCASSALEIDDSEEEGEERVSSATGEGAEEATASGREIRDSGSAKAAGSDAVHEAVSPRSMPTSPVSTELNGEFLHFVLL